MDKRAYWIWLQHAFPAGSIKPKAIYNRFRDLEKFYNEGVKLWSTVGFISSRDIMVMSSYGIKQAEAALKYAESLEQKVITPECGEYPSALWNIPDPPAVLYVRGVMPDMNNCLGVAVVGSRKTQDIVLDEAEKMSYELSKSGAVVISGGAIGVDAAAHRGAMKGVSPTVAVLGCGLDFPYLLENELLRQKIIAKGGALVTEYPPGTSVQKGTFQNRNRIISGMARAVLIVSGAKKSGTMITARRATEQNRDIFAVPGNPMEPTSVVPNNLIKDGAVPVTSGYDIIDSYKGEYSFTGAGHPVKQIDSILRFVTGEDKKKLPAGVSDNAGNIYSALGEKPKHISEICALTGLTPSKVLIAVTELEILGLIESLSGQRYMLKN